MEDSKSTRLAARWPHARTVLVALWMLSVLLVLVVTNARMKNLEKDVSRIEHSVSDIKWDVSDIEKRGVRIQR